MCVCVCVCLFFWVGWGGVVVLGFGGAEFLACAGVMV